MTVAISSQYVSCSSPFDDMPTLCRATCMTTLSIIDRIRTMLDELAHKDGQKTTAQKIGMDQGSLSKFIGGKKKSVSAETLLEAFDALGFKVLSPEEQRCPPTVCDMGDYALVPKVRAKAGAGSSLITDGEATGMYAFRKDFLKRIGLEGNSDLVLFDVMGDSMEPTILDKDTVLASKRETDPKGGQIYVIRVDDELLVKRILREPGKLIVKSDNPEHGSFEIDLAAPSPNFEIIGRVRWQGRVY